ncbi:haloacid dehalogenase-like hydrolase domain-containing protein Sgpp [Olea europaea var. sylvestris]|uniref:Haloacid dehalogenase-like hydrolase domain-containing Sgpp n=1 Tax=Olea europaea subsp. europaea TaxID=158383 RepID=A0A8S0U351_OLEEU|nr:haloacid dehalogenase-like hydrolase domain-containing protein Sgpp [Olea europaea var. sylvestris]CAA3013074.1 haloacid dehalogenase-like hydrolase domain-containing Sgpp [Olea europaea subsp. europaea]
MCQPVRRSFTHFSFCATLIPRKIPSSSLALPRTRPGPGSALGFLRSINPRLSGENHYNISLPKICGAYQKMTISSGESSTCSLSQLAPLEAVLFDVDGTLCDSDPIHFYAFCELLPKIGFNGGIPIDEEFYSKNFAGKHNDEIASFLFPDDFERGLKFCEEKEDMFRRLAEEQLKPVNGLYKVIKWVEDRGLKRAAVTNAPKPNAEFMISTLGLTDFFHTVILGSDCEHAKPFPDAYLKALEILNISKDHTFIFEDSVSGIKAGVAAGMPVIGLTTGNPAPMLMEAKPTFLIKDYEDPKLWAVLEELDSIGGVKKGAA